MAAEELQVKERTSLLQQTSRCHAAANTTLLPGKTHLTSGLWLNNNSGFQPGTLVAAARALGVGLGLPPVLLLAPVPVLQ